MQNNSQNILDLLEDTSGSTTTPVSLDPIKPANNGVSTSTSGGDLLDLLGGLDAPIQSTNVPAPLLNTGGPALLDDLLDNTNNVENNINSKSGKL